MIDNLQIKDTRPHLIRQYDLIPQSILSNKIQIIGAGAIGGWVAILLAKMGMENIEIWDFDTVSLENMNSQPYSHSEIGQDKVDALQKRILDFTNTSISNIPFAWEGQPFNAKIVFACADSMAVRRQIFEVAQKSNVDLVIDTRMGAEIGNIYAYDPKAYGSYDKTLFSDDEADPSPCTAKATVYTSNIISGYAVKIAKDYLVGKAYAKTMILNIRDFCFEAYV